MLSRLRQLPPIAALSLMLLAVSSADAGWMGFRNDTNKTLIVQESIASGSSSRSSQPQKIYANETIRDNSKRAGGQRTFTIYDAASPDKPLHTAQFAVPADDENVLYVLKIDAKGVISVEAVRQTPAPIAKSKR